MVVRFGEYLLDKRHTPDAKLFGLISASFRSPFPSSSLLHSFAELHDCKIPTLYFAFPPAHSPNSFLLSKTRTILRRDPFEQRPEHGARQMFRIQTLSKSQDSPPLQDLDPHQDDEKTCMISIPFGSLGVDG
ncbi:unnamed protein product [Sympodiomycopsis kandeliae]